jgi:hypothetical protein
MTPVKNPVKRVGELTVLDLTFFLLVWICMITVAGNPNKTAV